MKLLKNITLDLENLNQSVLVKAKQGDHESWVIRIGLKRNGEDYVPPGDVEAVFRCLKPDGCSCMHSVVFDGDGRTDVVLTRQMLAVPGTVVADLSLIGADGGTLSTASFSILVEKAPVGEHVASTNDFVALQELVEEGRALLEKAQQGTGSGGTGGGAPSDWNASEGEPGHVLNRTHWIGTETIDPTFDGDMTGRETVQIQEGAYAVKVSPQCVDVDTMVGAAMTLNMGGSEQSMTLTAETVMDASEVFSIPGALVMLDGNPIIISLPKAVSIMGLSFSAGTWFMCEPDMFHVKALSCLDTEVEIIHKLDEKFLPENIGGSGGVFTVTVTDNGSGSYTADKTIAELDEAYQSEKQLICVTEEGLRLSLICAFPGDSYFFGGTVGAGTATVVTVIITDEIVMYENSELLTSDTAPTTLPNPRALYIRNALAGNVASSAKATYGSHETDGSTGLYVFGIANPYELTINGTKYDGSAAVDMTDVINSMIDSKLASMTAAEEVSF